MAEAKLSLLRIVV